MTDPVEAPVEAMDRQRCFSLAELCRELGITPRSLRFYEDKGLIAPARAGTRRIYSMRDRARAKLVVRGKQLGFTLKQIKDLLDLYDADPQHRVQKVALLKEIQKRIRTLHEMNAAIATTLADLENIQQSIIESFGREEAA